MKGAVSQRKLAVALSQLALLLRCNVPITQSLLTLAQQEDNLLLRQAWEQVLRHIESGCKFSQALSLKPQVFSATVILMARAGEESGDLDGRLARAAELTARRADQEEKLAQALSGPAFTALICGSMLLFLIKFVFPRFIEMYSSLEVKLPLLTKIAMGLVNMLNHPSALAIIPLTGAIWLRQKSYLRQQGFRLLLWLPWSRKLVGALLCSQFCDVTATLYTSGVPLQRALRMLAESSREASYADRLAKVAAKLEMSGDLAKALQAEVPFFPPALAGMLVVGQETGQLDQMLLSMQQVTELEAHSRLEVCLTLIEPLILAALGLFLSTFFLALLLPMYDIISKLAG